MKLKLIGVSVSSVACPACAETIQIPALMEATRRPAKLHFTVDDSPVREHVERRHPEVAL